jgi:hypothetical protein
MSGTRADTAMLNIMSLFYDSVLALYSPLDGISVGGPVERPLIHPRGKTIEIPIGLETLSAAGATVCLSDIVSAVRRLADLLERAAAAAFSASLTRQGLRPGSSSRGLAPGDRLGG